jgi:hypothetical protein
MSYWRTLVQPSKKPGRGGRKPSSPQRHVLIPVASPATGCDSTHDRMGRSWRRLRPGGHDA